ncbi:MAG: nucleotidyltransferase [Spirochaeta sp. LUC14_002_19_P3]|nr:MAG: nucleotidyltransferase [Spirochaeta sp. LUC14_002_19_P3]
MIDYEKLKKALKRLQEQNKHRSSLFNVQETYLIEAVKESTIQRFETCWDCLWKVLRRYLMEEIGLSEVANGPKPVLRLANENYLLPSPIEVWLKYGNARINTSHDYSGEKADEALEIIDNFVSDAITLYQTLSGETWE